MVNMTKTKIYIASSWKNELKVRTLAETLREQGFEVDDFTDPSKGRYVFKWSEIEEGGLKLDALTFLKDKRTQRAFREDKGKIEWSDVLILLIPAGNSSHLEMGYAAGLGKKTIIFAPDGFPQGHFDTMYGFADLLTSDIAELVETLRKYGDEDERNNGK